MKRLARFLVAMGRAWARPPPVPPILLGGAVLFLKVYKNFKIFY